MASSNSKGGECPFKYTLMELKSLPSPPREIKEVGAAMVILLGDYPVTDAGVLDSSSSGTGQLWEKTFKTFQKTLSDPKVADRLLNFDVKIVTPNQARIANDVISHISLQTIKQKSRAAVELFQWVQGVVQEAGHRPE